MAFTAEKFQEMIKILDKDGDGSVSKDEFKEQYLLSFENAMKACEPDSTAYTDAKADFDKATAGFDEVWSKMDVDGDGDLTVDELAKHYGFDLSSGNTYKMSDEAILEMLQLQAQLDELNEKSKKVEKPKPRAETRDPTIKMVNIEKKKKDPEDEEKKCIEFLELLMTQELIKVDKTKESVDKMLDEFEEKPFAIRCENEKGEMPLHMLARCTVKEDGGEASGPGIAARQFVGIFAKIITNMRKEGKAQTPPRSLYADVNHQDKQGKTPLYLALEYKNTVLIDQLFALGKDGPDAMLTNINGWTAMHAAVHTDDLPVLKKFIENLQKTPGRIRFLMRTADKQGREPLHIAAYKCTEEMVAYLMDQGAESSTKDTAGSTASSLADRVGRRRSKEIIDDKMHRRSRESGEGVVPGESKGERARRMSRELPSAPDTSKRPSKEILASA